MLPIKGARRDALEGTGCQKGEDAFPVARWTIRELQRRGLARGDRGGAFGRLPAQARRRHPIPPVERVVEPAQAGEAAGEGDLGDRQRRFGQELFGEQQPAGQQQLYGRHSQLLLHDAPDLPRAQLELVGDVLESGLLVESAFFEPLNDQLRLGRSERLPEATSSGSRSRSGVRRRGDVR